MQSLWLYLHFPQLQLDKLMQSQSTEQGVIVVDSQSNQVMQLNQPAQQAGIQHGMGLASAALLLRDLQVIEYQPQQAEQALQELAHWLYAVTADICLYPPDGLLLRIHNMLMMYGGLSGYWQTLRQHLKPLGYQYTFATGPSPLGARLLARLGWNQCHQDRRIHLQALQQAPLQATDLNSKQVERLSRIGVHSLRDLLQLPLPDIAKRFDIQLVTLIGRLKGELQHPHSFYLPAARFFQRIELLYEVEHSQGLIKPMYHLLSRLEHYLKVRDSLTDQLDFALIQRDKTDLPVTLRSAEGVYRASQWQKLAELQLEQCRLQAPIVAIALQVEHIQLRQPDKVDLFAGTKGTLRPLQLVSLLQAKLGEKAVRSPQLRDDWRPEKSSVYAEPLHDAPSTKVTLGPRPSVLLSPPVAVKEKLSIIHGPERIEAGWWDKHATLRDYYIARNRFGQWLWVFRTPHQKWFIHGYFC